MRIIPQFPKYQISEDGTTIIGVGKIKKPLSHFIDRDGYHRVNLYTNTSRKNKGVHQLVAMAYIPNPNNYNQVNHLDGNKSNNHYTNLEWCSAKQNIQHGYDAGLYDNAKKQSSVRAKAKPKSTFSDMGKCNRKLSDDDIRTIRHLANTGQKSYKELAFIYKYDSSSIGKIVRKQRYSDVE